MKERLLIKCDTTIYADEITNLLIDNKSNLSKIVYIMI